MGKTALALCILVLAPGVAQAQLSVTDKTIQQTGKLKLDIHYPVTGRPEIDRMFAKAARDYGADGELNNTSEGANSGDMSYEVRRNDKEMFSVQVSTYTYYAGHAHGMPDMDSYNFLRPKAERVFLPELVDGQHGLDRIHQLVIADLTKQLGPSDFWTRPRASSFQNFAWLPDALELTFTPYEIAGYAQGELKVRIPLSDLAGVIRPDPHAPAPSFSCSQARTVIETSICSDAALARLDRQNAEHYADWLAEIPAQKPDERPTDRQYREAQKVRHDQQVAGQRSWLAQRNQDCASGSTACLIASYRARQAALRKAPY